MSETTSRVSYTQTQSLEICVDSLKNTATLIVDMPQFAPNTANAAPSGPNARASQSPRVIMMNKAAKLTKKSRSARSMAKRAREKENATAVTRRFDARIVTIRPLPAYWRP